jgi:hypothetical protein
MMYEFFKAYQSTVTKNNIGVNLTLKVYKICKTVLYVAVWLVIKCSKILVL